MAHRPEPLSKTKNIRIFMSTELIVIATVTRRAITDRQIDRILILREQRAHRSIHAAITKIDRIQIVGDLILTRTI